MAVGQGPVGPAPTLELVAARAGVSRATASRVLNGSPKVSQSAVDAVTRVVEELQYRPNRAARSLVTRRANSIAFAVTEPDEHLFSDPFIATFLRGAHDELVASDMQLVLVFASGDRDRQRLERYATDRHVDGLVLISLHGPDRLPLQLEHLGVPVVLQGRPVQDAETLYWVDADNIGGAELATRTLIERGCQRVATITGPQDMVSARQRLIGYKSALSAAGRAYDPELVVAGDFTRAGGIRCMERLLNSSPDLDGVFAASDPMALGALSVLRAAGRRVPDDVALVGFDDAPEAKTSDPPLTTIRQPTGEMGREATKMLINRLAGLPTDRSIVLPTELVVRATA